jgi:hypothetical protein
VDRFSFFFAFYGLILGLAVTELLSGIARLVRARVPRIELQTALLALLTFLIIVATWIEAWDTMKDVRLSLNNLWAPVLLATCYYLAASVVFPSDPADFDDLAAYYTSRKAFVVAMLVVAEVVVTFTYQHIFVYLLAHRPAEFWLWMVPFKLVILGAFAAIYFARARRANLIALGIALLLFTLPYWQYGIMRDTIARRYGYTI